MFYKVFFNDNKSDINNFRSFGDGMRDLYEKGVLRNDFILVSGNILGNAGKTTSPPSTEKILGNTGWTPLLKQEKS